MAIFLGVVTAPLLLADLIECHSGGITRRGEYFRCLQLTLHGLNPHDTSGHSGHHFMVPKMVHYLHGGKLPRKAFIIVLSKSNGSLAD